MKVYIITDGEYSDYGIMKVFLDKKKAEKYVSLACGLDEDNIEEWDSSDEDIIQEIKFIDVEYVIKEKKENTLNNPKIIKLQNMLRDKATTQGEKDNARTLIKKLQNSNKVIEDVRFDFKIDKTNTIDTSEQNIKTTCYYESCWGDKENTIHIDRVIHGEIVNEEKLKQKYLKVCQDLYAKIKSLKELEGWTSEMIDNWVNDDNVDKYIKNN